MGYRLYIEGLEDILFYEYVVWEHLYTGYMYSCYIDSLYVLQIEDVSNHKRPYLG